MAIVNSVLTGKAKGKVGSVVLSTNAGKTIAREYNPYVANPNTVKQVNQRSAFKLLSQLAAALSNVIVIPKDGLISSRNGFVSKNKDFVTSQNGQAMISYENIQLTNGNTGIPAITVTRVAGESITVKLADSAINAASRVVYVLFRKSSEAQLQYLGSAVQSTPGDDGKFTTSFGDYSGDIIIWAYGIKDVNAAATAAYGNYHVNTGEDIAQLVMSRNLSVGNYVFTQTRGATLFDDAEGTVDAGDNEVMVYITASGPGSVSGEGFTGNRKAVTKGTEVTVVATPNAGCEFKGWKLNGGSSYISTAQSYTFTANAQTDLIAEFNNPSSGSGDGGEGGGLDKD